MNAEIKTVTELRHRNEIGLSEVIPGFLKRWTVDRSGQISFNTPEKPSSRLPRRLL
jgi:hypothetical protein